MPRSNVMSTRRRAPAAARRPTIAAMLALGLLAGACAHVPPEAVDLSQRMGRDLATVHAANRELARSYFASLRRQADDVVDNQYRPFVLEQAIDRTDLLAEIDKARRPGAAMDPLDVMQVFVEEAIARIDSFRAEVHAPIDAQEREVLRSIDDAHDAIEQGNAAITAHLVSLRKVQAEQDTLMRMAGLPTDTRARFMDAVVGASGTLGQLLARAKAGSVALDSLPARIERALHRP